jgi:hypothetical protein
MLSGLLVTSDEIAIKTAAFARTVLLSAVHIDVLQIRQKFVGT